MQNAGLRFEVEQASRGLSAIAELLVKYATADKMHSIKAINISATITLVCLSAMERSLVDKNDLEDTESHRQCSILVTPGLERVQPLADISRSALCCHSDETRVPIANPPNSAQLEGTPTVPSTYIRIRAVVWECGEEQTRRRP